MVLLTALGCAPDGELMGPRDVLLISVDTLRADALGCYGNEGARTPTIDGLSAAGTTFDVAYVPVAQTTPALASMMTGLDPDRHGSHRVGAPIGREVSTLAGFLRGQGFATIGVSANLVAGRKQGLHRGFETFIGQEQIDRRFGSTSYHDRGEAPPSAPGSAQLVTDLTLAAIDRRGDGPPYFIWAHYFDPHSLYRPPSPWQDKVKAPSCWALMGRLAAEGGLVDEIQSDVGGIASQALDDCRRLYGAEVDYVDHEIGRLLHGLDSRGLLRKTLIVLVADHGENFGEEGLFFEHGPSLADASLRIPMIFSGPGVVGGVRRSNLVSIADVAPTIVEGLGLEISGLGLDGHSLFPLLRSAEADEKRWRGRTLYVRESRSVSHLQTTKLRSGTWARRCLNGPELTLCRRVGRGVGGSAFTLHRPSLDPRLERDISATRTEDFSRLRQAWDQWPIEESFPRAVITQDLRLSAYPRLEGGWDLRLTALGDDPKSGEELSAERPDERRRLEAALIKLAGRQRQRSPGIDRRIEEDLRSLGYIR